MPDEKLRIMVYRHSVFYSPLIATIGMGYLKQEGLDATYFPKPQDRNQNEKVRRGEREIMLGAVSISSDPVLIAMREILVRFAQISQRTGFFGSCRSAAKSVGR